MIALQQFVLYAYEQKKIISLFTEKIAFKLKVMLAILNPSRITILK